MTAEAGSSKHVPQEPDPGLESKVFIRRGDKMLIRHLGFSKAAGERPNSLRISVGTKHGTALTLKNKSFAAQYRRAVDAIAKFHGIPEGDPIRKKMEATAHDYLAYYKLRTQAFKFERHGDLRVLDDVAFPVDIDGSGGPLAPSGGQSESFSPQAMLPSGLVRGITFRTATSSHPAHIHVRRWRGKAFSLSLENVSFAVQYEKAVKAIAESLGLANDDPTRTLMHRSAPAFLQHYGLTTAPVTIPDVVVIVQQPE